jgi:hypothetical protein
MTKIRFPIRTDPEMWWGLSEAASNESEQWAKALTLSDEDEQETQRERRYGETMRICERFFPYCYSHKDGRRLVVEIDTEAKTVRLFLGDEDQPEEPAE